jgi:hypothetical protein
VMMTSSCCSTATMNRARLCCPPSSRYAWRVVLVTRSSTVKDALSRAEQFTLRSGLAALLTGKDRRGGRQRPSTTITTSRAASGAPRRSPR